MAEAQFATVQARLFKTAKIRLVQMGNQLFDFTPAVMHLERYETPPVMCSDEKLLFDLIRASFNQRRKKLTNGIVNYAGLDFTKEQAEAAIEKCGFRPDVRGEMLSLADFAALADAFADII